MKFKLLINIKIAKINVILRFKSSKPIRLFLHLSRINFVFSRVEHEKRVYILMPSSATGSLLRVRLGVLGTRLAIVSRMCLMGECLEQT